MEFKELFNRITYGLPVTQGLDDTRLIGREFLIAKGAYGEVKYSKNPKRELLWGHDHLVVRNATGVSSPELYASNIRVNEDGAVSIAVEPGHVNALLPRLLVVPRIARAFSPLRDNEALHSMRFELSLEEICALFRSAYVTQGDYLIPSSSSFLRNPDLSPGRS